MTKTRTNLFRSQPINAGRYFIIPLLTVLFTLAACVPPPGPEAFFKRGKNFYDHGDYKSAYSDLQRIAERGHIGGQYLLAQMYANGDGVSQDLYLAARWYQKAAEGGLPEAQYTLGLMHQFGTGGQIDLTAAIQWHQKAAHRGYAPAQLNLANLFSQPESPQYNLVQAYKWYSLVLRFDLGASRANALRERRKLDKIMTEKDIRSGLRIAREWEFPTQ